MLAVISVCLTSVFVSSIDYCNALTGWAKKVIPLVHILHCTRGRPITFLAHPVYPWVQCKYADDDNDSLHICVSTIQENRAGVVLTSVTGLI